MTVAYDIIAELFVVLLALAYCVLFAVLAVYWVRTAMRTRRQESHRYPTGPG